MCTGLVRGWFLCHHLCDITVLSAAVDTFEYNILLCVLVVYSGCWFVGGDDLTGALHVLQLQLSPLPPSFLALIKSRIEIFWYRLTQVHLENGR